MSTPEEDVIAAFAEALDAECGIALPGLAADLGETEVRVSWHGEELARWDERDPEDPLDPSEVAEELMAALGDPRADVVELALRVVGRELPGALEAARRAGGEAMAVGLEDRGVLGQARHWTTDADLERGWPEVVVVVTLGESERALPIAPEQHPHAIDLAEVEAAARALAGAA